jgi:hypothetical protein
MWQDCLMDCQQFVVLAEGLYLVIWELLLLATKSLRRKLLGWTSGDWSQKGWDRVGQWPPHYGGGGSLCLKISMMGEGELFRAPMLNILWHFHSSWGKSREVSSLSACSDFYSWGSQIESRPRHRMSWLRSRYFSQSLEDRAGTVLYLYESRQIHICKYVRSHIALLHQHVLVSPVTIITVSHNKNTISIQIIVQKCMISSGFIIHLCTIVCTLIVMLQDTLMMVTGGGETRWLRIIYDGT